MLTGGFYMYKTFLLKFTKNVVYASGFSFLYERFNQKYMYDTALYSPLPKNSSHYKLIHTIFCEMGADLSKKNLKIATTDKPTGILAGCSSFPFASDYDVMVSMSMVRRLSK